MAHRTLQLTRIRARHDRAGTRLAPAARTKLAVLETLLTGQDATIPGKDTAPTPANHPVKLHGAAFIRPAPLPACPGALATAGRSRRTQRPGPTLDVLTRP